MNYDFVISENDLICNSVCGKLVNFKLAERFRKSDYFEFEEVSELQSMYKTTQICQEMIDAANKWLHLEDVNVNEQNCFLNIVLSGTKRQIMKNFYSSEFSSQIDGLFNSKLNYNPNFLISNFDNSIFEADFDENSTLKTMSEHKEQIIRDFLKSHSVDYILGEKRYYESDEF